MPTPFPVKCAAADLAATELRVHIALRAADNATGGPRLVTVDRADAAGPAITRLHALALDVVVDVHLLEPRRHPLLRHGVDSFAPPPHRATVRRAEKASIHTHTHTYLTAFEAERGLKGEKRVFFFFNNERRMDGGERF